MHREAVDVHLRLLPDGHLGQQPPDQGGEFEAVAAEPRPHDPALLGPVQDEVAVGCPAVETDIPTHHLRIRERRKVLGQELPGCHLEFSADLSVVPIRVPGRSRVVVGHLDAAVLHVGMA